MRPLLLQGHERAITQIKYNRDGDLLFTCSKDKLPTVWHSQTGERLGTYGPDNGHNGAVWSIDVSWDSKKVVTGSGDASWRLWDCETGRMIRATTTPTSVRSVSFSYSGHLFLYATDAQGKTSSAAVIVKDTRDPSHMQGDACVLSLETFQNEKDKSVNKVSSAVWGPFDESIICGHNNGGLSLIELRQNDFTITNENAHSATIMDIQKSKDDIMFVTASKDTKAKLFDSTTLEELKTYKADRPVNSAAISPIKQHILLGGGQEAMQVTTTDIRQGKFEARFFHMVFEEEFGRVKGHFGPINSVAFHPDGNSFSTGGEDGYVRVHTLDDTYFDFDLTF
ncbi:hypothetical protein RvY_16941 [Ramazzottius varieornatus]|uniref:Eukaryotic translation initiation factor 3 subunit I n=1 Tax=Ramazzottius varieornatus TaxID=947166 RepID=A0A1D1W2T6_RAMVA|nr:hypothetical protein RvY_16941 [Ramazzottius varieornatus]